MVFSSLVFLFLFLPCTLAVYFVSRSRTWRNVVLLAASLAFYAWGEPKYIWVMIASIALNWAVALAIDRSEVRKGIWLACGIAINLTILGLFKYLGFFSENLNVWLGVSLAFPHLLLPIGISFYTFQAISYLADIYRQEIHAQKNPLFFGTYLAMFPQLVAGPIVRYKTIEHELEHRHETLDDFAHGLRRFGIGLAKKVLVANTMGLIADQIVDSGPQVGAMVAWTAFIAYSLQIYFDFSAYSDMAIGLGRMFGFRFLENFNYPYISRSITEFWRRWHISLSSFFKDYVYIPLGGNRVRTPRWILNLFIVWGLTGLWHGASWNFVLWGLYFGVILAMEKLLVGGLLAKAPRTIQHAYVIVVFILSWVLFRIEGLEAVGEWFATLFGSNGLGHISTMSALNILHLYPWIFVAIVGSTPLVGNLLKASDARPVTRAIADVFILGVVAWSIIELVVGGFNPFIYFRF